HDQIVINRFDDPIYYKIIDDSFEKEGHNLDLRSISEFYGCYSIYTDAVLKHLIGTIIQFDNDQINQQDEKGNIIIHLACHYNNWEFIEALLKNGADPKIKNLDKQVYYFQSLIECLYNHQKLTLLKLQDNPIQKIKLQEYGSYNLYNHLAH